MEHKNGDKRPTWYLHDDVDPTCKPSQYPPPQPHPSTKDFDKDWGLEIDPQGPVGLFIESIVWNGLVVDDKFRIWQPNEQPVDILAMPFQNLKKQVYMLSTRARTRDEWARVASIKIAGLREIDRDVAAINPKLTGEEQAMVRTVISGIAQPLPEMLVLWKRDSDADTAF